MSVPNFSSYWNVHAERFVVILHLNASGNLPNGTISGIRAIYDELWSVNSLLRARVGLNSNYRWNLIHCIHCNRWKF
jgi:hypothetical protein